MDLKKKWLIGFILTTVLLFGCGQQAESSQTDTSKHLYLDVHKNLKGLTAKAAAEAHKRDLAVQDKYGVKYINYWYNEEDGTAFCLSEAPSKEAAMAVHREANGIVADEIIEVTEGQ